MMAHAIFWKRQAILDLIGIGQQIAQTSRVSAERMVSLIESKVTPLADHPNLGKTGRRRGVRELIASEHYVVVYRNLPATVEILRVKHIEQQWP
jgi:toxin ParE1/3/4